MYRRRMLKTLAIVIGLVGVGCGGGGGDKCERAYDKMAPLMKKMEKEMGGDDDKKKDDKTKRAESLAECRADLKQKPAREKNLDCILAIKGEPTMESMTKCFNEDEEPADKQAADKEAGDQGGGGAVSAKVAAEALAKMTEFKDKMCACKDKACADTVTGDMTKWSEEMSKTMDPSAKPSDEDMKKMTDVGTQMGECMAKAMATP